MAHWSLKATTAVGRSPESRSWRAAEVDPDMAVNIEHEDAAFSQTEGLALAAKNLRGAAAVL